MTCPAEVTRSAICRKRGDTYPITIAVSNKTTGQLEDITGNDFTLSVSPEDAPVTANYLFQSTGIITDAVNGAVSFAISTSDADNLGNFYFDIQMSTGGSSLTTIMGGTFTFIQDITK